MFADCLRFCLDFVIPYGCAGCDNPVPSSVVWCQTCRRQLSEPPAPTHAESPVAHVTIAAHSYVGPVQHAIHRFKFSNRADLAHRLGRDVAQAMKAVALPQDAILIPVPLTAHRLVERGYNQSALLARCIAGQLGLEHLPCALVRVRDGHHQVGANKSQRTEHVSGAFAAASRRIDQRNVILIDDVITTGATSSACIAALTAAGARVVAVAAIARVG